MTVPVLNTGSKSECALSGSLAFHTAVWYTLSLFLQLRARRAGVGGPQKDVTSAVPNATSGAGAQTQTPG